MCHALGLDVIEPHVLQLVLRSTGMKAFAGKIDEGFLAGSPDGVESFPEEVTFGKGGCFEETGCIKDFFELRMRPGIVNGVRGVGDIEYHIRSRF